jgi:Fur family transcriptional regulator, ferric uptake regulator
VSWAEQASKRLDEAGYRSGGARRQVVELLAGEECALTALEMDRQLPAGRASIYRTLEQLEALHLVQKIDIGGEAAGYERLDPGEHHHHLVCEECGILEPFADQGLERAIAAVSRASNFEVETHDVVLKGTCPSCAEHDA